MSEVYQGSPKIAVEVSKTLAGTGATTVNLFQLTGSVKVNIIYGTLTAKTTLANMTVAQFALYDSSATVNITLPTGGTMSTAVVGAVIYKNAAATVVGGINLAATGTIIDSSTTGVVDSPFIATQKNGANSFIRFNYSTTDNPIACTFKFFVEYESINGGTLVAV